MSVCFPHMLGGYSFEPPAWYSISDFAGPKDVKFEFSSQNLTLEVILQLLRRSLFQRLDAQGHLLMLSVRTPTAMLSFMSLFLHWALGHIYHIHRTTTVASKIYLKCRREVCLLYCPM